MTPLQHATRIGMLMAAAAALLGWVVRHSEPTFADGLRYIHQAERIERGGWRDGLFERCRPPASPAGNRRDASSDRRRQARPRGNARHSCSPSLASILLVIPVYLLCLELFGEQAAWLACLLVTVNPIVDDIVVNVLSESTFLLWWTFGLWCAVRFLRDGRFLWLPPAIGLGGSPT